MIKISKQQLFDRWDNLPQNLREALVSEYNADILWRICEAQHLSKDKISVVATIAGDAILGFIHSEDLAQEIRLNLNLNPEIANLIAYEIDRKIFAPIRGDLRKNYAPAVAEAMADKPAEAEEALEGEPLTPVADIRPPAAEESAVSEREKEFEKPSEEFKPSETPASISVSAKETEIPELKKEEPSVYSAVMEGPAYSEAMPASGEAMPASGEAMPAIIHKEEEIKPISQAPRSLGGLFGFLKKGSETKPESQSITAQVILTEQTGKLEEKPEIAQTEKPKMRVVHYSEFSTPVDVFGKMDKAMPAGESIGIPQTEEKNDNMIQSEALPQKQEQKNVPQAVQQSSSQASVPEIPKQTDFTYAPESPLHKLGDEWQKPEELSVRDFAPRDTEMKGASAVRPQSFTYNQEPEISQPKMPDEIELKDIPVGEDTIDLRQL